MGPVMAYREEWARLASSIRGRRSAGQAGREGSRSRFLFDKITNPQTQERALDDVVSQKGECDRGREQEKGRIEEGIEGGAEPEAHIPVEPEQRIEDGQMEQIHGETDFPQSGQQDGKQAGQERG